ncbi:MAG: N-acetyltransferase [Planctomycetia bacterium]|nr:N-acetyltransferase [Planctomycetia bacterium]
MELNLRDKHFEIPPLPPGFRAEPWNRSLLDAHARTHYMSFRDEPDAKIFESFRTYKGSRQVVEYMVNRPGFLPEATWLITYFPSDAVYPVYVAGIQAGRDHAGFGAVQNIGVIPEFRHRGLGFQCLSRALIGFQKAGVSGVRLEVTATNESALGLYRKVGFVPIRVLYRAIK